MTDRDAADVPSLPEPVRDLTDPLREAAPEPKEQEAPAHLVTLFDPARPDAPRVELAANFDPHRHVRWENRPSVAELDLAAIGEEDGKPLLTEGAVQALQSAGIVTLKDILRAGESGLRAVRGVGHRQAAELYDWAARRHAVPYALAELAVEVAPEPVGLVVTVPAPEPAPDAPAGDQAE